LSKTKADLKTEPEKVVVMRCPLSGIPCSECGYGEWSETYACFLREIVSAITEVGISE